MRWWVLAGMCLLLVGCVAPTEVKQASGEVGVALSELREAQVDFRDLYLRELEETRQIVGRAIVAHAVVAKVGTLSAEEVQGDLIAISAAIKSERDAYRALVDEIMHKKAGDGVSPEDVVDSVLRGKAQALRESADALDAAGQSGSATKLRARADELESGADGIDQYEDLVVLVELQATKADVRAGMKDLDDYLRFLQLIHTQVHEWVTTDVTVKGEEVAALIERHAAVLGLEESAGGAP